MAYGRMKDNFSYGATNSFGDALTREAENMIASGQTEDHKAAALAFVEKSQPWIDSQRASRMARPALVHPDEPALRKRALRELPPALRELAVAHGISVTGISVRNQRSRWGACSAAGAITLNWRLILVPDFVREYVMLHELMHRRELNHSERFWRHVRAVCPRHQEARQWLLSAGQRLFTGTPASGEC